MARVARAKVRPFPKTFSRDVVKELGDVPGIRQALKRGIGDFGTRGKWIQVILRLEAERYFVDLDLKAIVNVLDAVLAKKSLERKKLPTIEALSNQIHKHLRIVTLLKRYKKIWNAEARRDQKQRRLQLQERAADSE